jgi:hypothetical protein
MNQNWRDLIGGIFLVPLMHIGVFAFFQLIMTITHSYPLGLVMIISFYCIGITQLIYLIPIVGHYRKKQRWDVVKGITIGTIATIVISSAYNRAMLSILTNLPEIAVGAITIGLMLITFYGFNYRSNPNKMNQNWRDLIRGIFLVPALHLGFLLLMILFGSIFNGSIILSTMFNVLFYWMGISQFVYLIPVMLVFRRRRRFEMVKGITIGAILTILLNAACFTFLAVN